MNTHEHESYELFKRAVHALKIKENILRTEADRNISGLNLEFTGLKSQADITLGGKLNITNILLVEINKKLDYLILKSDNAFSTNRTLSVYKPPSLKTWRRKQ